MRTLHRTIRILRRLSTNSRKNIYSKKINFVGRRREILSLVLFSQRDDAFETIACLAWVVMAFVDCYFGLISVQWLFSIGLVDCCHLSRCASSWLSSWLSSCSIPFDLIHSYRSIGGCWCSGLVSFLFYILGSLSS
jgi:hypothetical protein